MQHSSTKGQKRAVVIHPKLLFLRKQNPCGMLEENGTRKEQENEIPDATSLARERCLRMSCVCIYIYIWMCRDQHAHCLKGLCIIISSYSSYAVK